METSDWQASALYPNVGTVVDNVYQPRMRIQLGPQFLKMDLANEIQFRLRTKWANGTFFTNLDDSWVPPGIGPFELCGWAVRDRMQG
jgi:hypothetical protein